MTKPDQKLPDNSDNNYTKIQKSVCAFNRAASSSQSIVDKTSR